MVRLDRDCLPRELDIPIRLTIKQIATHSSSHFTRLGGPLNHILGVGSFKQLHYIGSHFYIRKAEVVAEILEHETDVGFWEVYAILGSYALTA